MPLGPRDDLTRSATASAPTIEACVKAVGTTDAKRGERPRTQVDTDGGREKVCRWQTHHAGLLALGFLAALLKEIDGGKRITHHD